MDLFDYVREKNMDKEAPVSYTHLAGPKEARMISFDGKMIPFGPQILFVAEEMQSLVIAAEICEDVWSTVPPSIQAAREGACLLYTSCLTVLFPKRRMRHWQ